MWSILIIDDERNFCAILEDYIARDEKRFYVRKCFTHGSSRGTGWKRTPSI